MTTKHTAGPWKYDGLRILSTTEFQPRDEEDEPNPTVVVNLLGAMGGIDQEADAQLIAAAPELLSALIEAQKLVNLCRQYMPKSIKNSDRFTFENTAANIIDKAIKTAVKQ